VQETFAKVAPIANQAAELIYNRLFEIAPRVREMFRGDMAEQKKKLMATLMLTVDGLDNPDKLVPVVQALGARYRAMAQRTSSTRWLRRPCCGPCSKTLATPSRTTWRAPGLPFTP
jgi:hypothetical protein